MRLCVQTNKYSKLHKCPRLKHVESIFKEFQVAPKGIKKLIFLPKETLNSNVKTCTWKSFPLQREQVPTKPMGVGRNLHGAAASEADSTVLSLGLAVTFPAKENRSAFTQCLWTQVKKEQERDFEPKGFLSFLVKFHMTHWERFMNGLPWKGQDIEYFSVEASGQRVNSPSSGSLASISQRKSVFLLSNSLGKEAISQLSSLSSTCRHVP